MFENALQRQKKAMLKRYLEKWYKLEDIGFLKFEPMKVEGKMQNCMVFSSVAVFEWYLHRTINGEKTTKKLAKTIDEFLNLARGFILEEYGEDLFEIKEKAKKYKCQSIR